MSNQLATDYRATYRHWIEVSLPSLAEANDWEIRLNHCFARVILDNLFQGDWHHHLKSPAWLNLNESQLIKAIAIAELIAQDSTGRVLYELDKNSHEGEESRLRLAITA